MGLQQSFEWSGSMSSSLSSCTDLALGIAGLKSKYPNFDGKLCLFLARRNDALFHPIWRISVECDHSM